MRRLAFVFIMLVLTFAVLIAFSLVARPGIMWQSLLFIVLGIPFLTFVGTLVGRAIFKGSTLSFPAGFSGTAIYVAVTSSVILMIPMALIGSDVAPSAAARFAGIAGYFVAGWFSIGWMLKPKRDFGQ